MVKDGVAVFLLSACVVSIAAAAPTGPHPPSIAQRLDPPKQLKRVEPVYPENARQARIQGVVTVEATIGPDGKVKTAKIINSIPLLDEAALTAVRQWEYAPTIINGVATPVIMTVKVNFALSAPKPAPPPATPVPPSRPGEWDQLSLASAKLTLEDKQTEAIALVEKFANRYPNHLESRFELGRLYESRSRTRGASETARRRDLETAVKHYERAYDLLEDPGLRFVMLWKLEQLYAPDELNVPAESERYARRMVADFPDRAESHMVYAQLLREKGDIAAAADAIRNGRAASTLPLPGLLIATQYPVELVQSQPALPREEARARINEAAAAVDAILKMPGKSEQEYRLATMAKGLVLELQAERLAETRQQRIAWLVEAERWSAPIAEHRNGAPPAPRKLSAAETADIEWRAVQRWNTQLADTGHLEDAIAGYRKYLAERPGFYEVHDRIADLSMRAARDAKDDDARSAQLERAAASLQQLVNLAPPGSARDNAFGQLLDLYGPAQLKRPAQEEATARAMIRRQPAVPRGHAALVAVLLRTGKAADAETALRSARTATAPAAAARAGLATAYVHAVREQNDLPPVAARRLFDAASELLTEAEKLRADDLAVIEGRMSWLNLSAERFETDPARAAAQRAEADRLRARALALRTGKTP